MTGPDSASAQAAPRRHVGRGRLVALAAAAALAVVVVLAVTLLIGSPRRVEAGIVVAVSATSLSDVQGFSIRTADGRTIDFKVGTLENAATFPLGHLAEHRASLVPVQVTYVEREGARVALRIEDAGG